MALSRFSLSEVGFRLAKKGFPRQRRCFTSPSPPPPPKKVSKRSEAAKERKMKAVKLFVDRYMVTHCGVFPKAKEVRDEVGGSWYILKDILTEMKTKMLPGPQIDSQIASSELDIVTEETPEATVTKENPDIGELDRPEKGFASLTEPSTVLSSVKSLEDTVLLENKQMDLSVDNLASLTTVEGQQQSHSLSHITEDEENSISMHRHEATPNGSEEYLTDKKYLEPNQNSQATDVSFLTPNQSSLSKDITAPDQKIINLVNFFKRNIEELGLKCRKTGTWKHETSSDLKEEKKHVIGLVDVFKRDKKSSKNDYVIYEKNMKQDKTLSPKEEIREDSERKFDFKILRDRLRGFGKGTQRAGSLANTPNNKIGREMRGFVGESIKLLTLNDQSERRKLAEQTDGEEPREVNPLHSDVSDNTQKNQSSGSNIVNVSLQLNKNGKAIGSSDILESQPQSEESDSDIAVGLKCRKTGTWKHETSSDLKEENKHVIGLVDVFKRDKKSSKNDDVIYEKNMKQDKTLSPKEEIREDPERKFDFKVLRDQLRGFGKGTQRAGSLANMRNNKIDMEMRGSVGESIKLLILNDQSECRKPAEQTDGEEPREVNPLHSDVSDNTQKNQSSGSNIVNVNLQLNKNGKAIGSSDILESQPQSEESDSDIAAFDYPEPESIGEVPFSTQQQSSIAFLHKGTGNHENRLLVKFLLKAAKINDIDHAFHDCGPIAEIRIVPTRRENRYNYAYVCFEAEDGLIKALSKTDVAVCGADVVVEAASPIKLHSRMSNVEPVEDVDFPAAFLKDPTRTVIVEGLPDNTSFYQLKCALSFWGHISGLAMGSTGSSVYVEYESEESKERALTVAKVSVVGKKLPIYRVDAPKTTVVRISRVNPLTRLTRIHCICESCGQLKRLVGRDIGTFDVHFKLSEYGNMVKILNRLNGMVVDHHQWVAQPATVIPVEVLQTLWSKPEHRKHVHELFQNLCRKIEEKSINTAPMLSLAQEYHGDS